MDKILVVDDEKKICNLIKMYLDKEGYQVELAYNGKEAIDLFEKISPSLVILDILLPEINGFEVCKKLRKKTNTPIIMLTAKDEETDKVLGLELGADDYVTKPFSPRELVSRIKAVLRRTKKESEETKVIEIKELSLNREKFEVKLGEKNVSLTSKEFEMIWLLASSPSRVFSRKEIQNTIWGYESFSDERTVDQHIKSLRKKIKSDDFEIETIWGRGYRLKIND